MKYLKTFIAYLFFKPRKHLKEMSSILDAFTKRFEKIQIEKGIESIVPFFQLFSDFQDSNPLAKYIPIFQKANHKGKYNDVIKYIKEINAFIGGGGRQEYGWNRTKKGEMVTPDNVYLGNVYGLYTKTVSFWKNGKNDSKGGWGFSSIFGRKPETMNGYDTVSEQARIFMISYTNIFKPIGKLNTISV